MERQRQLEWGQVLEFQENFLRGGVRELRPLTRALVAQQVGAFGINRMSELSDKAEQVYERGAVPLDGLRRLACQTLCRDGMHVETRP